MKCSTWLKILIKWCTWYICTKIITTNDEKCIRETNKREEWQIDASEESFKKCF